MTVFIDTSAIYALLSVDDENHARAQATWVKLANRPQDLMTSNYVLVETSALLGWRLGFQAVRDFETNFVPALEVRWVDLTIHRQAVAALLTAAERSLSLVDCVSFELMRQAGLNVAFAFDVHFSQQGFELL